MERSKYRALREGVLAEPDNVLPLQVLCDWFEEEGNERARVLRAGLAAIDGGQKARAKARAEQRAFLDKHYPQLAKTRRDAALCAVVGTEELVVAVGSNGTIAELHS